MAGRVRALWLAVAIIACSFAPAVASASVVPMSAEQLAAAADTIVEVRVSAAQPRRARAGASWRQGIVTDVRLHTSRVLKGSKAADFTLTQPGGMLEGVTLDYAELPELEPGDHAILFLSDDRVVGGFQGSMQVVDGYVAALGMSLTDARAYLRSLAGSVAVAGADGGSPLVGSAESGAPFPLLKMGAPVLAAEASAVEPQSVSALAVTVSALSTLDITSVSPSRVNAGIGDVITIVGTGLPVSAKPIVEFRDGHLSRGTVAGNVLTYTSTRITCEVPRYAEGDLVYVSDAARTVSDSHALDVGFSASDAVWHAMTVSYRINENSSDLTGEGAAIRRAFDVWNGAGANLVVGYGGSCETTVNSFDISVDANGYNDIFFASSGFPDGVLAWNVQWSYSGKCFESDIVINDTAGDGTVWADGAVVGRYDVQSVITHELGHTYGIDDQYAETDEIMGAASQNATRRQLTAAELEGARHQNGSRDLVPPTAPSIVSSTNPVPGAWYRARTASFDVTSTDTFGVDGYSYSIDATAGTVPDQVSEGLHTKYTVTGIPDGSWYLHIRAVDPIGNWGPASHFNFRVDGTAPVTTDDALPEYPSAARIHLTAVDPHSGVAQTRWRVDGGAWNTGTAPFVSDTGTHTLEYLSSDVAGNVEATRTLTVRVRVGVLAEDSSPFISWAGSRKTLTDARFSGAAYSAFATGTSVRFAFSGTGFALVGPRGPRFGRALVSVDGAAPRFVSEYSLVSSGPADVFAIAGLSNAIHTVVVTSDPLNGISRLVGLDAVRVAGEPVSWPAASWTAYGTRSSRLSWAGSWSTVGAGSGTPAYRVSDSSGSLVRLAFQGTSVRVVAPVGPEFGIAAIRIDGGTPVLVDLSRRAKGHATVFVRRDITGGKHTISVQWTGRRGLLSRGTAVGLEAVEVEQLPFR